VFGGAGQREGPTGGGFTVGSRVNIGMGKTTYATSEYLYSISSASAYTLKSGIGWDIGTGENKDGFFRPEIKYHWVVTADGDRSSSRHIWEFRVVLGYKWENNN